MIVSPAADLGAGVGASILAEAAVDRADQPAQCLDIEPVLPAKRGRQP